MADKQQEDKAPAISPFKPDIDEPERKPSLQAGRLAGLPIAVFLTVFVSLWVASLVGTRGSSFLATAKDFAIISLLCGFAAYLVANSFLTHGTTGLLPLGCGIIMWGLGGMAASSTAPQNVDLGKTIYFSCKSLSALCLLVGAFWLLRTRRPISRRVLWLPATYTLAVAAVAGIALLASAGWIPSFFVPDWDVMLLRQPGPVLSIAVFVVVAFLLGAGTMERNPTSPFTYWYALVAGLLAAGIFGAKLQSSPGVYDWTGPFSQFLSGLYMLLIAVVASQRESRAKEIVAGVALRKNDDLYHLLFENMTEGFFIGEVIYDKEGKPYDYRHLEANPAYEVHTGRKREQTMGKTSREVFFPRPTQIAIDKFCEAGACGRASHFDFYSIVFRKHLDMYVLPCGKDKFGALFMDITARKEAERRLRESNDLLRTVVEAAPTAIIGLDLDGNVQTVWNRAAEKMLGWTAQEAMGHPLPSVPAAGQEEFEGFREEIRRGLALDGVEVRRQRKDGTPVDYSIYASPLHDAEGRIAGNIAVLVDITERKRMEDALRELNATLENKVVQRTAELEKRTRQLQHLALQLSQAEDRERKRIGAILHEDFQQQIAGAKLHLSLLNKRAKDDPPQQEIIARVDEILKDAIEQSRSLAHELSPAALSQNDLAEVLRWLAARMEAEQGLSVQVDAQDEVILQSDALTVFLFRAVQEMLLNVVKHTKARDATIRMSCHGRYVCISVCDRGRGFNPEEIGETTGFGLMNIRERCEMLGGRLKIKSHKDIGTTLYLTVPNEDTSATDANLHAVCVQGK